MGYGRHGENSRTRATEYTRSFALIFRIILALTVSEGEHANREKGTEAFCWHGVFLLAVWWPLCPSERGFRAGRGAAPGAFPSLVRDSDPRPRKIASCPAAVRRRWGSRCSIRELNT